MFYGNLQPQAQGSNAANPDNAEADARRQENPVEPPVPEPPAIMESLCHDNEPHSNGHPPMQGIDDEQVSAPQPDLGLQALSVNHPIQLMVRSDLQNRADARVSSLSVEVVGPRAAHVYAPSSVVPAEVFPPLLVQAAVPAPAPVPAPVPAVVPTPAPAPVPVSIRAPAPGPVLEPPPAPAVSASNSSSDAVEEGVSSLSSESSTTVSTDSSDEDNLPLSFFNRNAFPRNGMTFGLTGRLVPGPRPPAATSFLGQLAHLRPIQITPPTRAIPRDDEWFTDDESSDSGTEPSSSKRRRQMDRRE